MRSPLPRVITISLAVAALTGLAACDTGDGKRLRPVDPATTSTSTIAPVGSGAPGDSIETGPLPSVPLGAGTSDAIDGAPTGDAGLELYAPWIAGAPIDARYTCDGEDIAPPLSWANPPEGTVELAFSMIDESTSSDGEPFMHWVLAGVDPAEISLLEGAVPAGAIQAENSFGTTGWNGPCPPEGEPEHTYRFTMHALSQQVELAEGTAADELLDYIQMVSITSTDVTGTYGR